MKLKKIIFISLLSFLGVAKTNAQDDNTTLVPPTESKTQTAGVDEAIIIVTSNCDNLIMSHSVGIEKVQRASKVTDAISIL